jgi:hypothetical protein
VLFEQQLEGGGGSGDYEEDSEPYYCLSQRVWALAPAKTLRILHQINDHSRVLVGYGLPMPPGPAGNRGGARTSRSQMLGVRYRRNQ